jgi:hypothetical protein
MRPSQRQPGISPAWRLHVAKIQADLPTMGIRHQRQRFVSPSGG